MGIKCHHLYWKTKEPTTQSNISDNMSFIPRWTILRIKFHNEKSQEQPSIKPLTLHIIKDQLGELIPNSLEWWRLHYPNISHVTFEIYLLFRNNFIQI